MSSFTEPIYIGVGAEVDAHGRVVVADTRGAQVHSFEYDAFNRLVARTDGLVPIVRRTGGLADSVEQWNPATKRGTGIVFNDYDAPAVRWALHTALDLFKDRGSWLQMMRNAMAQDFSWDRQSRAYAQLYQKLTAATP